MLEDFIERFDEWVQRDDPPGDWQVDAMYWIHGLQDTPYTAASRRPELGVDWWFALIPGAEDASSAVVCLYSVDEINRRARCSAITTLDKPIT